MAKKPRIYQNACVNAAFDWLAAGNPNFFLLIAPVAAGKSLIIAEIIKRILTEWGRIRIVQVVHSVELITQNAEELMGHYPEADWGYYSASIGQKRLHNDVSFCGIQSIYNKANSFNRAPQVIIIDEVHMVSHDDTTMYRKFIDDCLALNPNLVVIGLSGCKWRADTGRLDEGETRLFEGIAYEIPIQFLIEQGYWVRPTTKDTHTRLKTDGVGTSKGDYIASQLEKAVDIDETTQKCVDELIAMAGKRKRWFGMAAGVQHCTHIRDAIRARGIACEMVVGDTKIQSKEERKRVIAWSKEDTPDVRALVNVGTLNVGFNNPLIDLLFPMRPSKSPVLYYQYVGRGVRPIYTSGYDLETQQGRLDAIAASCKPDVLVCDFAGIVSQLGPVDALDVQKQFKPKDPDAEPGKAITKRCPSCGAMCAAAQKYCYVCSYSFAGAALETTASKGAVITDDQEPEERQVISVEMAEHHKRGDDKAPTTLKVTYITLGGHYSEYICFNHAPGYALDRARHWHRQRLPAMECPKSVEDAMWLPYPIPGSVMVKREGKFWRVLKCDFTTTPQPEFKPDTSEYDAKRAELLDGCPDIPF